MQKKTRTETFFNTADADTFVHRKNFGNPWPTSVDINKLRRKHPTRGWHLPWTRTFFGLLKIQPSKVIEKFKKSEIIIQKDRSQKRL